MANSNSAAVREIETGLLAGLQNRRATVTFDSLVAVEEAHLAALAGVGVPADLRLEAFEVQAVPVTVFLPVLDQRIEHFAGSGAESLPLPPVRAHLVQVFR